LKPPTLELRVLDSTAPELVVAVAVLVEAVARRWLAGAQPVARLDKRAYVRARAAAARRGMAAHLCWNEAWIPAARCLDRFVDAHAAELACLDIPGDVWCALGRARQGTTMSSLVEQAVRQEQETRGRRWKRGFVARYADAVQLMARGAGLDAYAEALGVEPARRAA
jgi:gamma-glutamyl:cysteine ligase YbdK (ATP-grasp superfamily)